MQARSTGVSAGLGTGRKDRHGGYSRESGKGDAISHEESAWRHKDMVDAFGMGRPCLPSCAFKQQCASHFTPHTYLRTHEFSFDQIGQPIT